MGSELASLPLADPPSISLPPFLLSTCLFTEWSQFLEQVGDLIFFALPFGRGRVACGMEHGKLSRRQTPLAQTSWGPRLVLRGQVVSYSYGVTEHSLSFTESDLRGRQVPASLSFKAQVLMRVHLGREGISCLGDQKTSGQRPRLNWVLKGKG